MDSVPIFGESDWNNLELVRQIVLYRLKNDERWSQFDYIWEERRVSKFVKFDSTDARLRFTELATEVMWQLLIQGVITPGKDVSNIELPHFKITRYGETVLEAERFIPHDPTGYIEDLRNIAGSINADTTIAYVEEALNCFNSGCYIASALLLGVAAESIFNNMCEIMRMSLITNSEQNKLDPRLSVKPRHRWVVQKYENLPKADRRGKLPESLDVTLKSLYDLIRIQRNELGHPQDEPPELNRQEAFVFFQLFPKFVSRAQAFAKYCQKNGI